MPEPDDLRQLDAIREWFRERRITLALDQIVGDEERPEWVALMIPEGLRVGAVPGGVGPTKLAAAEDAKRQFEIEEAGPTGPLYREIVGRRVIEKTGGAVSRVSGGFEAVEVERVTPVEPEKLARVAEEYRIQVAFVRLDSAWWVRVQDEDGNELDWSLAEDWDDAKLAAIIDLIEPPKQDS